MMMQPSRRAYSITLFLILLVSYGYFLPRWADWGANSRANLTYAVGDSGVLYIDAYHTNTGDKACFPGPFTSDPNDVTAGSCTGHYYTDKSIGPSLLALPPYMIFRAIAALPPMENFIQSGRSIGAMGDTLNPEGEGIRPQAVYEYMALTFITLFASAVPSAFLGVVVFWMAVRFTERDSYAFVLALAYGLGTMALPYSNALYQHQLAAFGTFTGFYLLYRVIRENASRRWLWVVGVLFSFVVITEYPVVPVLAILFLWAFFSMKDWGALYRVVLGAIPLGLLFAAYNFAIFGTPLPAGYEYSTNWQGEHNSGFFSLGLPNLDRIYGLTLSPVRGIFVMSPFLILALWGIWLMFRKQPQQRGLLAVILLSCGFIFMYNASSVMWWGGFTIGPRYLIPMLPFMVLPIAFVLNVLLPRLWGKILVGGLVAASILSVGAMHIAGQGWPPVEEWPQTFAQMNAHSILLDHALPLLQSEDIARNYGTIIGLGGFTSLLPLLLTIALIGLLVPRLVLWRMGKAVFTPEKTNPPQRALQ
jgi:hypothetical protein